MCGRFAFTSPVEAVAAYFGADVFELKDVQPNTNVCPTQDIVTVVSFQGRCLLTKMRWGFIPHWYSAANAGPLLINARAETVAEKPAYKNAFETRHCIIPVDWYFEWSSKNPENTKQKYRIQQKNGEMLGCAAIWQAWQNNEGARIITCAMLTRKADETIATVHHRMPVILAKSDFSNWLLGNANDSQLLMQSQFKPSLAVKVER